MSEKNYQEKYQQNVCDAVKIVLTGKAITWSAHIRKE